MTKNNHITFNLHNVKPMAGYITAEMTWKDFLATISKEKPKTPYMVISEDGTDILYINSPIGCYRITLTKKGIN